MIFEFSFQVGTLATVGFGDIIPITVLEIWFTIGLVFIGTIIFSYITATVSSVLHDFDLKATIYRTKMSKLAHYLKHIKISPALRFKIVSEMSLIWKKNPYAQPVDYSNITNKNSVLSCGIVLSSRKKENCCEHETEGSPEQTDKKNSPSKRNKRVQPFWMMSLELHGEFINTSSFFKNFGEKEEDYFFIVELINSMKPASHGNVVAISPLDSGIELMTWQEGESFGEIEIFLTKEWAWNMKCATDVDYFVIPKQDFLSVVSHYRSVSQKLVKLTLSKKCFVLALEAEPLHCADIKKYLFKAKNEVREAKDSRRKMERQVHNRLAELLEKSKRNLHQVTPLANKTKTTKERWELVRNFVTKKKSKDLSFQKAAEMALQVKRFQAALDDVMKDVAIWKQGFSFARGHTCYAPTNF
ncbi:hypothetical protein RFI_22086 [Reticulomyxa filosa]|uniref:Cyclic nucleotide-binding domain-containing protein n=1 Tax=Reticulomyxa filosa TaxID=46433 RepID=X6MQB2_RETFI|nr:hypothetical protein RFI_22086 [Reticulomyxa filosa]|eukprot:ETO15280.1 hypothetical protein RFI_22086 [Reticulomyxa filosa]